MEEDIGSLERARARLYRPGARTEDPHVTLAEQGDRSLPHAWEGEPPVVMATHPGRRRVRLASIFFVSTVAFFILSLALAGYFLYYGSNSISVDKIAIDVQGPTTIAGGDTVPLLLFITNKNPSAVEDAILEIGFPEGTRSATDVLQSFPRYVEDLGTLESGATITRSIKAIVFGEAGETVTLPISFSYGTSGANATFEKKLSYPLAISSTPLSLSVETLAETVSGKPLTLTLTVRSNAKVPLSNVVLNAPLPFGFSTISSSVPLNNSSFLLGTMAPGATRVITLVGALSGQENENRVFRFSLGTAKSAGDQNIAITYMSQEASVAITAPFIDTSLAVNGDTSPSVIVSPDSLQNISVSYINRLDTNVANATVSIGLSGSAIDYNSIRTSSGFYDSTTHSILFSPDTDPALEVLAPGASGVGAFTFRTLPTGTVSPSITFTISVSGTRIGQTNVPEQVSNTVTKRVKVATTVLVSAAALHSSGPFSSTGPIPPETEKATTYTIQWNVRNGGSAVADGVVTATLPSYVTYTKKTDGDGTFSYSDATRTVSWSTGNLGQGASVEGAFQVSITPSTSQRGDTPTLASAPAFSGHDRFAGVKVSAMGNAVTTELRESGAPIGSGTVQ